MTIHRFFRRPALLPSQHNELLDYLQNQISSHISELNTEYCFYVETPVPLKPEEIKILTWLLSETFEQENFSSQSFLSCLKGLCFEAGPRLNFVTSWSTNAVAVCRSAGLTKITRIERSRRYELKAVKGLSQEQKERFLSRVHDRMTECPYLKPLESFVTGITPEPVFIVPLMEQGIEALKEINKQMGLGFDRHDIDYYYELFIKKINRNPTSVECFDLAQSNSEHSRHWFFKGRLIVNGQEVPETLFDIVKKPFIINPRNSIIAFKDNSSAIRGAEVMTIIPETPGSVSAYREIKQFYHITFTAETHNFPSGVAPFPGAETGTGGRIRDVQAVGRGGLVIAGTAAYCVGNLNISDYNLPWEDSTLSYPDNLASPLDIEIKASNGASDYGNKFGEPIIQGFTRSFGLVLFDSQRWEWIKPIMFTGGVGQIDEKHREKNEPEKDMLIVKVGGPAYRIGMGGGAASSMIHGENVAELDLNAVQRGDAEMEQKMNRVIRTCVELGSNNPIVTIHDQGAGGNCNVVKELIYPAGGEVEIRNIEVGDTTLSVLEIWGAEYQENNALLLRPEHQALFTHICGREKVPVSFIGHITNNGIIIVHDSNEKNTPVNLALEHVLSDMPAKTFYLDYMPVKKSPLMLPQTLTFCESLTRVLRLLSVGSKRFLTNKVDRSVTGLIARQQCVGPLHLTVSDVAVIAQSHFGLTGAAISIGEQPIKTLLNPSAMVRLSVTEALTNIVWARVTGLSGIKCSANWMWAPKLLGEGQKLYEAARAMSDFMIELGIAVDGGKDSLSMAAALPHDDGTQETVKSPGTLVISAYAACPDITQTITPDFKAPGKSRILFIDLAQGKNRLGGSALAHVFAQVGNESPDMEDTGLLKRTFNIVQKFIDKNLIRAGHDRSDGGLITTILEMAFSGNCGFDCDIKTDEPALNYFFSEEPGLVVEYLTEKEQEILSLLTDIPCQIVGSTRQDSHVTITYNDTTIINEDMKVLRALWEETSFHLELQQVTPHCAHEERKNMYDQQAPPYRVTFTPMPISSDKLSSAPKPKVGIVREEGSNGDREMASAFHLAGFESWDVTMTDLQTGKITLDSFRGIAFVGGFSYADVLDSAKGWAGVIRFNKALSAQFQRFYERPDTFSLGVCNGCQLMALLGWVPWQLSDDHFQPRFVHNDSARFESRFSTVKILPSPSIMLKGMEGSVLGVWVAHGEGKVFFPHKEMYQKVLNHDLAPLRYVDDRGEITTRYPFNPNGSPLGITALCSPDGRHLAMMPHPERTFLLWQWPWIPENMQSLSASPWLRMFQNARKWCKEDSL
jgi:phosphoribosylformylglycinamidine synthase